MVFWTRGWRAVIISSVKFEDLVTGYDQSSSVIIYITKTSLKSQKCIFQSIFANSNEIVLLIPTRGYGEALQVPQRV